MNTLKASWCMTKAMLRAALTTKMLFLLILISGLSLVFSNPDPSGDVHLRMWVWGCGLAIFCWVMPGLLISEMIGAEEVDPALPLHPTRWPAVMALILWGLVAAWALALDNLLLRGEGPGPLFSLWGSLVAMPLLLLLIGFNTMFPKLLIGGDDGRPGHQTATMFYLFVFSAFVLLVLLNPSHFFGRIAEFTGGGESDGKIGGIVIEVLKGFGITMVFFTAVIFAEALCRAHSKTKPGPGNALFILILAAVIIVPLGFAWIDDLRGVSAPHHTLPLMKVLTLVGTVILVGTSLPLMVLANPQAQTLPIKSSPQIRWGLWWGFLGALGCALGSLVTVTMLKIFGLTASWDMAMVCAIVSMFGYTIAVIMFTLPFVPEQPFAHGRLLAVLVVLISWMVFLFMAFVIELGPSHLLWPGLALLFQWWAFGYLRRTGDYAAERKGLMA